MFYFFLPQNPAAWQFTPS